MIRKNGEVLEVSGSMTLTVARELLKSGVSELAGPETIFSLAAVDAVDSSALAVIFGWLRAAKSAGKTIRIVHPTKDLLSLAALYGVTDLLPLGTPA